MTEQNFASPYHSITVDRFRGIESAALDRLTSINVLVGPNGCGKTSLLEALALSAAAGAADLPGNTNPVLATLSFVCEHRGGVGRSAFVERAFGARELPTTIH